MKKLSTSLVALFAAAPLSAAIIYVDFGDVSLPADSDLYVNVVSQQVTNTLSYEDSNLAPWLTFFHGGSVIGNSERISPWTNQASGYDGGTAGHFFSNVPVGSTVSLAGVSVPSLGFLTGSYVSGEGGSESHVGNASGQFVSGSEGFLVFSYEPVFGSGSFAYGWVRFTAQESGAGLLMDAAYSDTPGEAVIVGAIPEPAACVALVGAAGLLVVGAGRRRRTV